MSSKLGTIRTLMIIQAEAHEMLDIAELEE